MSFPWKFAETKYLRILKIYGSEDFKEHKIQLPGFYTLYSPFWAWNLSTSTTQRGGTIYPHPQVLGILKAPIFCNMCSVTSSWNWQPFSLKSVTSISFCIYLNWVSFWTLVLYPWPLCTKLGTKLFLLAGRSQRRNPLVWGPDSNHSSISISKNQIIYRPFYEWNTFWEATPFFNDVIHDSIEIGKCVEPTTMPNIFKTRDNATISNLLSICMYVVPKMLEMGGGGGGGEKERVWQSSVVGRTSL